MSLLLWSVEYLHVHSCISQSWLLPSHKAKCLIFHLTQTGCRWFSVERTCVLAWACPIRSGVEAAVYSVRLLLGRFPMLAYVGSQVFRLELLSLS